MKKKLRNLGHSLIATWFGVLSFESIEHYTPELVQEFNGYDINDPVRRRYAFEKIALPFLKELDELDRLNGIVDENDRWREILAEALTFSNKELFQVFEDSGMVFMTPVEDPHAFLVDLWNVVFPDEATC